LNKKCWRYPTGYIRLNWGEWHLKETGRTEKSGSEEERKKIENKKKAAKNAKTREDKNKSEIALLEARNRVT